MLGGRVSKQAGLLGEGGMIFLLPMMVYVCAFPLSGVVRLVLWAGSDRLTGPRPPNDSAPATEHASPYLFE
jgi:hypothetical protein